jgi:cytochrome c
LSDHDPPLVTFVTDACPDGDDRSTVFVRNVNSHVTNYDTGDGCTINDLIVEEDHPKKKDLRQHVDEVTAQLEADGVITRAERKDIREAAGKTK